LVVAGFEFYQMAMLGVTHRPMLGIITQPMEEASHSSYELAKQELLVICAFHWLT
jgi:hypothetical protein